MGDFGVCQKIQNRRQRFRLSPPVNLFARALGLKPMLALNGSQLGLQNFERLNLLHRFNLAHDDLAGGGSHQRTCLRRSGASFPCFAEKTGKRTEFSPKATIDSGLVVEIQSLTGRIP
jgi:hypothetical protein